MSEIDWQEWYKQEMDAAANQQPMTPRDGAPAEMLAELAVAERLARQDFGSESRIYARLRLTLEQQAKARRNGHISSQKTLPARGFRYLWVGAAALLILIFVAFHNPVLAAVQRTLGYGYVPEAGFIRLSGTRLIKGPVQSEYLGEKLLLKQGFAESGQTKLWFELQGKEIPTEQAWIETEDGERLPQEGQSWESLSFPDTLIGSLTFPALPPETKTSTFRWGNNTKLPMEWIPADQAGLAPTQVNYPYSSSTPMSAGQPCLMLPRMSLCLAAVYQDASGAHLLLEAKPGEGVSRLDWDTSGEAALAFQVTDDRGRAYSQQKPLSFIPGKGPDPAKVTIDLPAFSENARQAVLNAEAVRVSLDGRSQTFRDVGEITFTIPDRQMNFLPTPLVQDQAQPVPTPQAP